MASSKTPYLPGGWGPVEPANSEIQQMVEEVKSAVEARTGQNYDMFKAIEYRSQVVAGMNYCVLVQVGGDSYLELYIFGALSGNYELEGVKEGLKKDSPIGPHE